METLSKEGIFQKTFQVLYSQIDKNYNLKPICAIDMLQNTAISHSNFVGYSLKSLKEKNLAWLLKGWAIEFVTPISENEELYVNTWTKAFKRLQADRNFIVYSKDKEPLIKATSRWFLIDTQKRRPLKIDDSFLENYIPSQVENPLDAQYKLFKIATDNISSSSSKDILVQNSHLDINNHVNNAVYILWAMDCISFDILDKSKIKRIDSIYLKEITLDDKVTAQIVNFEEANLNIFLVDFLNPISKDVYAQVKISLTN